MKKFLLAMGLMIVANAANAVQVYLVRHNLNTSDGPSTTMITDGSGFFAGGSTATWDWDGTTLTATGDYSAAIYVGSTPYGPSLLRDKSTNLSINTSTSTATGSAYQCDNGTFLGFVQFCGGYTYGGNYINESTLSYGPGLAFDITIGGDDALSDTTMPAIAGVRNLATAYAFGLNSWDGTNLSIGTGIADNTAGYEELYFTTLVPVPAAAWLFGSALGLLGWARRRASV